MALWNASYELLLWAGCSHSTQVPVYRKDTALRVWGPVPYTVPYRPKSEDFTAVFYTAVTVYGTVPIPNVQNKSEQPDSQWFSRTARQLSGTHSLSHHAARHFSDTRYPPRPPGRSDSGPSVSPIHVRKVQSNGKQSQIMHLPNGATYDPQCPLASGMAHGPK
ncbi:hypothetical protein B0H12DRAFT_1067229 [Mycena haematopus]|nr:hypothetical protein B0H12DRAFT_1067229 [Mycena haematopus]